MKRDFELIRLLLMQQEEGLSPEGLARYDEPMIVYNLALMIEAGLIEGHVLKDHIGEIKGVCTVRLTWAGHDFLDSVRDPSVWNRAKEKILKPGFSWTFSILAEFLKAEAKRRLGDVFGAQTHE